MRVLPSLVASCFAGVAASSKVYELYYDHSGDATSVSPEELALSLSERLGVSRYHKLGLQGNLLRLELDGGKSKMFQERIEEDFVLSIAGAYGVGGTLPKFSLCLRSFPGPCGVVLTDYSWQAAPLPESTRVGLRDMPKTSAFGELMDVFVRENRQFLEAAVPRVVDMSPWGGTCVGVSEVQLKYPNRRAAADS